MTDRDRLKALITHEAQDPQPAPCVLCGTMTRHRGIFAPANSQDFGAPTGKTRTIVYAICARHPRNEKTAARVEAILLSEA